MNKKIGILSIHGLPAMHGAFEQTVDQIINQSNINNYNYSFYVGCEKKFNSYNYDIKNVNRIFL